MKSRLVIALLLSFAVRTASGQTPAPPPLAPIAPVAPTNPAEVDLSRYVAQATRTSGPLKIDGHFDEAAWQGVAPIGDFTQYEPDAGKPPSEATEVRILYDSDNLYFAVRCHTRDPKQVLFSQMQRDADLNHEDSIQIFLDTFHDGQNAFFFQVNPLGARTDGVLRREGEELNTDWDGIWEAESSIDAGGWNAEIAIPFRTLRFPKSGPLVWGFNVKRKIPRLPEESFWTPMLRSYGYFGRYKVSRYGELRGLEGLTPGGHVQATPFLVGRRREPDFGLPGSKGDAGGDVKWNITSNVVADVTVNTDFAEAEADLQQFNVQRFKLFYPEKREFFLEGSNLFYFGDRIEPYDVPERFTFFFSRQIGLAEDGLQEIPILGGAKVSGKIGSTSVGFLDVMTDRTDFVASNRAEVREPRTNYSVLRVKQDVWKNSSIGLIGLSKDPSSGDSNRGAGMDWDLAFGKKLSTVGYVTRTATPGLDGRDSAYSGDIVYQGKHLRARTVYTDVGENFNPEMGFLTRLDIRKSQTDLGWILFPDALGIHKAILIGDFNHVTDHGGNLQSQVSKVEINLAARRSGGIAFLFYDNLENLYAPLVLARGVAIPPGHYRFKNLFTGLGSSANGPFGFTLWWDQGGYYNGDRLHRLVSLLWKGLPGLQISGNWDRQDIELPNAKLVKTIVSSYVTYSISPTLLTRAIVQWSDQDNFRGNFLFDWTYRPGSDIYLVYNDIEDLDDARRAQGFSPLGPGRTITLKVARRFDF
jgi:hypothetical protein